MVLTDSTDPENKHLHIRQEVKGTNPSQATATRVKCNQYFTAVAILESKPPATSLSGKRRGMSGE